MMRSLLLFCLAAGVLIVAPAAGTTYLIRPNGTGDFATITLAIQAAVDGDTIELADGTFQGPGNRNLSFQGKAITLRSQSGDPARCMIDCEYAGRGFFLAGGEGPASVVEAITVKRGLQPTGGAFYLSYSSPTIRRCVFFDNSADNGGAMGS